MFGEPFYPASIPENSPIGTLLTTVTATDADIGVNGQVVFTIEMPNPLVEVNNVSGQITLTAVPDFETTQALIVEVRLYLMYDLNLLDTIWLVSM